MEEPHNIGSNMKFVSFSNKQINISAPTCANLSINDMEVDMATLTLV
jgi:hypothetical protein